MTSPRSIVSSLALGAALAFTALPAAWAQPTQPSAPGGQPAPLARQVTDKEIDDFAAAATEIREINKQWAPKLDEAAKQGPEAQEKVRDQALGEMAKAVERKGMSVDRYQEIFTVARADPEIRRKIVERMPKTP
jgi:hypothetical protein